MTLDERAALDRISASTSEADLKAYLKNAKGKSAVVHRAAFDRLVAVSVGEHTDPVAKACWTMIYTVEQIRRELGRPVARMNRLRPKVEREGERAALAYCALNETDGFREILDYGLPQYTAEAIVLGYPEVFPDETLRATARQRLSSSGVDPARYEGVPLI